MHVNVLTPIIFFQLASLVPTFAQLVPCAPALLSSPPPSAPGAAADAVLPVPAGL